LRRDLHRESHAAEAGLSRRSLPGRHLPGDLGAREGGAAPMRRRGRSGNMVLEVAMWMPVFFLLITGTIQFGKITYVYYTLRKTVNTVASYLAAQNGVNYCDLAGDATITNAVNFALTGSTDGSGTPAIPNLTA